MRCLVKNHGLTLVEVMVVLVILSLAALGVGVGLQASVKVPEAVDLSLATAAELNSELDNWRAVAWGPSPWPAVLPYSATDTVGVRSGGQTFTYPRTVTIKTWDPNNVAGNTSPQADFAQVQITINGQVATMYLTKPL